MLKETETATETYIERFVSFGKLVTKKVTVKIVSQIEIKSLKGTAIVTAVSIDGFRFKVMGTEYEASLSRGLGTLCHVVGKPNAIFDYEEVEFPTKVWIEAEELIRKHEDRNSYWKKL